MSGKERTNIIPLPAFWVLDPEYSNLPAQPDPNQMLEMPRKPQRGPRRVSYGLVSFCLLGDVLEGIFKMSSYPSNCPALTHCVKLDQAYHLKNIIEDILLIQWIISFV